ncbi:oocyte zinc finger protein XlCOF8.4-like isoform X2 [Synchiropus splendidus]|uniref:oocyte zinc finger protein XlCOF8.4-like isoform X2 n=1 Tax=Synchiropus splendidus TaxID=270530 RepID=UPI00237EB88B|nr:oocyte zinc finger protein XlCOF8.4-like isoform X2 [Synchiropus splendidus]
MEKQQKLDDHGEVPVMVLTALVQSGRRDVQQPPVKEEAQDWSSSLDQEEPVPPHIKQEEEEEDVSGFSFNNVVKSEKTDEKSSLSQLHQGEEEPPTKSSTQHLKLGDDGAEPGSYVTPPVLSVQQRSRTSGSDTDDSEDWRDTSNTVLCSKPVGNPEVSQKREDAKNVSLSCSRCGKCCSSKSDLNLHDSACSHEGSLCCSVCAKSFTTREHLSIHKRSHRRQSIFSRCTLIDAVYAFPILYDTSCPFYRDRQKKDLAWRKVSEIVNISAETCRKKWKSLRDIYLREKRKETERRSGSAPATGSKWRHSADLNFLDPFLSPREASGNIDRAVQEAEVPAAATASPSSSAAAEDETAGDLRRSCSKRLREKSPQVERPCFEARRRCHSPASQLPSSLSEDKMFLLSLLPSLQRVAPQRREHVKFQIHKLIYESSSVQLNPDHSEA